VTPRWTPIALAVSLALNLFVVGAIAGVLILRQQALVHAAERDPILQAADALPAATREAFRTRMVQTLASLGPGLRDARLSRRRAMARFSGQPFDRAEASADLARARSDDAAARGAVEEVMLDFAATLPPDQRAAFAKGLERAAVRRWMASHPGRTLPPP
jgi:uncharacterized membrane protein